MELLYLWIDNYKNIYKTGFNFSSEFIFDYDDELRKLNITPSEKKKLILFDASICNITAIIGRNGSGKSNLLLFIRAGLDSHYSYVSVFRSKEGKVNFCSNIEKLEISDSSLKCEKIEFTQIRDNLDIVFYSNSFSIYPEYYNGYDLDASLQNHLAYSVNQYNKKLIQIIKDGYDEAKSWEKLKTGQDYSILMNESPFWELYRSDLKNQVKFISIYKNQFFENPPTLNIYFSNDGVDQKDPLYEKLNESGLFDFFSFNFNEDEFLNFKVDQWFKNALSVRLILHILYNGILTEANNFKENDLVGKILKWDKKELIFQYIIQIISGIEIKYKNGRLEKICNYIKDIENKTGEINILSNVKGFIEVEVNTGLYSFIDTVLKLDYNTHQLFNFKWQSLSAGESAILTLFSRIHNLKDIAWNANILILIDEGELYLHPEWQRNFINYLNEYLPKFFNRKSIQVILTSHSPFLVSDLPKGNIILLNKEEESGLCRVIDNNTLGQTFGANIHSLFKESFFLENGTMGVFAKTKIDDLIGFLGGELEGNGNLNRDICLKQIKIIGEPIIRNYLLDLWGKKFHKDFELMSRDELIRELRKYKLEKLNDAAD